MRWFPIVAIVIMAAAVPAFAQQQQQGDVDQVQLADKLDKATSTAERAAIVREIKQIDKDKRQPYVVTSLMKELGRLDQENEERNQIFRSGQPLPARLENKGESESEYSFSVLGLVSETDDPIVIRSLVPFLANGNVVSNAVAKFGEEAFNDVMATAADEEKLGAVLFTVQKMLEQPVKHPLSPQSKRRIIDLVGAQLAGPNQKSGTVWVAVSVAMTTGDPQLRQRVEQIANSDAELQAMGVTEPSSIRMVRQEALQLLAGQIRK